MHRIRIIASAITLLALTSLAVADSPRRGVSEDGACPPECRPCPNPCPSPCAGAEAAQTCAVGSENSVR
jgi:hypothetical protein